MTDPTTFRFDGWTLQTDTGELTREGRTQRLTQQPLRILLELLRNPGRVVSRERLVEVLWPKGVVDYDNGLNVSMRKLRKALGDESETPRYIETVPRLGYRFIGALEAPTVEAPAPPPRAGRSHWPFTGGIVGGAALLLVWVIVATRAPAPAPVADELDTRGQADEPVAGPVVAQRKTSVRAYEHYLQGIFHRSRRDADAGRLAIAEFEAALREDPEYAEAWAGLSETYVGAGIGHGIPAAEAFEKSRQAAMRAVELDPGIAETHSALGQIHMFRDRDYVAAEKEYELARAANEKYGRLWHHLGMLRAFQGRIPEAIAAIRRARELEPMTLLFNSNHALLLYHARRYDDAIAHARELLAANPTLHQARSVIIRALVAKGDVAGALAELPLRTNEMPNISDAGLAHARAGHREAALAEIRRIEKLGAAGFGVGYEIAVVRAALGDIEGGCQALDLAWRDALPFIGWMRVDPRMDPLREQPCYAEILRRFRVK